MQGTRCRYHENAPILLHRAIPATSLPTMDTQLESSDTQSIWGSNVLKVKAMISLPNMDENLIRQALTAAHRDDRSGYHHDGNRDMLAPIGNTAITWCVRCAHKSKDYHSKNTLIWSWACFNTCQQSGTPGNSSKLPRGFSKSPVTHL